MKRERGKKDSISFKEEKKKKWEECGKVCRRLGECVSFERVLELKLKSLKMSVT